MDMREHAEGAVIAVKVAVPPLDEREARPPHERAVAEHPQIRRIVPHRPSMRA
jgi:hypothetical protein